jgi:RNA polymerase sigma-70 factor (TIGR02943 family)
MAEEQHGNINPSTWVEQHGDYLFNFAISRTFNEDKARDLVQETFLAALKSLKNFRKESSERTWLISILKRKIVDYYRKASTKNEDNEAYNSFEINGWETPFRQEQPFKGHWKPGSVPMDWEADKNFSIDSDEFKEIFQQCMSRLPDKWAATFTLKVIEENSNEEICNEIGITTSNLWVILHRARLQLRECIEKKWFN